MELHFQKALGLANEQDVMIAGKAIQCLWDDGWGMVTQEGAGANPADAHYTKGVFELFTGPFFLMYTALQRMDAESRDLGRLWEELLQKRKEDKSFKPNPMRYFDKNSRVKYRKHGNLKFDDIKGYVKESLPEER